MRLLPKGLRARSAWSFALLALFLSATLSIVTYQLARWYLLEQRESLATRQAMVNALVAQGLVAASEGSPDAIQESLRAASNARALLEVDGTWYSAVVELSNAILPASLVEAVEQGPARQRVRVNNVPYVVVGVALPGVDARYFEFVAITEYERTLQTLATVLAVGASVTTVAGALAGWLASRRVVRPLGSVAAAARAMSDGDLSRRLDVGRDPDLEPVVQSFNEMASSLEERIQRELRFTADVSHELRTPLTAMASAVGLAHRAGLSGRAKFAIDVLDDQVDHLRRLTLELLEISRIDAGVADLSIEDVDVLELAGRTAEAGGLSRDVVRSTLGEDVLHPLDRTRFERVLSNIIENADRYGGGATAIHLERDGEDLVVSVDDDGPGVPPSERLAIFGRFHRGGLEQPPDKPKGTGLGLALAEEHVRLHGGGMWVTDSPSGGARFVVRIPKRGAVSA